MKVTNLEVQAFRNLTSFQLSPSEFNNIIYGDNAQGKTNLLEAIWLFTGARSFRGSREKDFIPSEGELAGLELTFYAGNREQTASLCWMGEKRKILLNGIRQDTASGFSGIFCGVAFSPDHMSLVKDGPEGRRQMIDVALSQAYPKYATALTNYQKAVRQRNTLLKDISFHAGLLDLLDLWDDHIVNYGGYISALRDRYIRRLGVYAEEFYGGISGGKESFSLTYQPSFGLDDTNGYTLKDFQQAVQKALKEQRKEDLRLGTTSIGPHRDDLDIQIEHLSARTFGSQGQQRSSILALKLAESSILEEQTGEAPVIMLDDVMSELDKNRRNFLLNKLEGKQVFITCCDTSAFDELDRGSIFYMKAGMLTQQEKKETTGSTNEKEVSRCTST